MKKKELLWIVILLFMDQALKFYMEGLLAQGSIEVIKNFFSLELLYNTGAAWSILSGHVWPLIIIGIVILISLVYLEPTIRDSTLKTGSFSLLYAGTLGNLIDRILFGHVRDFFSFQFNQYAFPVFNLADVFIVIGACGILIALWKGEKEYGRAFKGRQSRKIRQISERKNK